MPKFLLEGQQFDVPSEPDQQAPVDDKPLKVDPAPARYLAETADYAVQLVSLPNPQHPDGMQPTYLVIHKKHKVVAVQVQMLAVAIEAMAEVQASLDKALGKDKVKS